MTSRWKKKNAPRVGQVWRCNKRLQHGMWLILQHRMWLVLDACKDDTGWKLVLMCLESGKEIRVSIRNQHECWEKIV